MWHKDYWFDVQFLPYGISILIDKIGLDTYFWTGNKFY